MLLLSFFPSLDFPGDTVVKNLPLEAGDTGDVGSIPESGRSRGVGNGNPLQYFCLENAMDRQPGGPQSMGLKKKKKELDMA